MDLELNQIRYFVAASEYGSFRKAANALNIRESAISRRVRDLENSLGASLFQRHNCGVCLTFAGQRFLHRARLALRHLGAGMRDVAAAGRGENGWIKVGIFSSLASGYLSDLLREYDKDHRGVRIDFIDGDPVEHVAAVRQLRLDVAFITGTAEWFGCETDHLWSERVFVVLPVGHRLANKIELMWSDLVEESFIVSERASGPEIHDYLVQRLAALGRCPDIYAQNVGRDNLLSLVAVGRGITVTSEATSVAALPGVVYRPVVNEILPFSAIWSAKNDNPAFRRLLSLARKMARAEGTHIVGGIR